MDTLALLPFFVAGLVGSVHCVGMCGGIVSAFSIAAPRRALPVAVVAAQAPAIALDGAGRVLAYNAGRIGSYMAAGALAGGLLGGVRQLAGAAPLQLAAYWLANLLLVALGLYLMNAWQGLARLESLGRLLWSRLQPLTRHLLPIDHPGKALALGALWGWLPCGMVYSMLMSAMLSGSAGGGAAVMLAFGLGTLPALFTMGLFGNVLQAWTRRRPVRLGAGLLVLSFGLLGLVRASGGIDMGWLEALCLAPPGAMQ
nr:sulfite exporter TauE/SafE family protein [uncultured Noviherbaspirillum sp.]